MPQQAISLLNAGKVHDALRAVQQGLTSARALGDRRAELLQLNIASRCHAFRADAISALATSVDAFTIAQELGDVAEGASTICAAISSAFALRLLEDVMPLVDYLSRVAPHIDDIDAKRRVFQVIGIYFGDTGKFDEAAAAFAEMAVLARIMASREIEITHRANVASLHRKLAHHHHALGELALMETYCARATGQASAIIDQCAGTAQDQMTVNMLALRGEMHFLQHEWGLAEEQLKAGIEAAERHRREMARIPAYRYLAKTCLATDRLDDATHHFNAALNIAGAFQPVFDVYECCGALANIAHMQADASAESMWRNREQTERAAFEDARVHARAHIAHMRGALPPG
jgi:tetratricopeptide (TPR) repeat protein